MKPLLLALLTLGATVSPGEAAFEKVFGDGETDRGVFVTPTRDGGFIVVGATESFGMGEEDVYLVRTDGNGNPRWSRTYGGAAEDMGWAVQETEDGFVIAGFTSSFGAGGFDYYLIKTNPDGDVDWWRTYGGEGDDRCWALMVAGDGGFVLAGETTSSGAGEEDVLLVRTDSSGRKLWSRTHGGERGDRCFSIAPADDGGYMLAGQTYSEGAGDRDAHVIKTNRTGELEWSRTFGGEASDVGHSIVRVTDGGFVVTGYTTSFAPEGDDPYLIKIDGHGDTEWTRVLPMEGINHTITGDQATDGSFFLVGFSTYANRPGTAALLVRADSEGHLQTHRDVRLPDTLESFGYTVRATADGGCVFTGHTNGGATRGLDLLLVKVELMDR